MPLHEAATEQILPLPGSYAHGPKGQQVEWRGSCSRDADTCKQAELEAYIFGMLPISTLDQELLAIAVAELQDE